MTEREVERDATVLPSVEERAEEARLVLEHAPDERCRTIWENIVRGYDSLLERVRNLQ